tara:strand:+ start:628 stop:801 length:174 start_codon:yes stop_codon:yes gene_type:complete
MSSQKGIERMKAGKSAPFDVQIAFNILALLVGIDLYDRFLKDKYGKGKTIDELLGLK